MDYQKVKVITAVLYMKDYWFSVRPACDSPQYPRRNGRTAH